MMMKIVLSIVFVTGLSVAIPFSAHASSSGAAKDNKKVEGLSLKNFQANEDKRFSEMDSNKDGKLTEAEIEQYDRTIAYARNQNLFKRLDRDHNGSLSPEEFGALVPPASSFNAKPMIERMDTNRDGVISQAEFDAFLTRRFEQLDANKDQVLTPAELRARKPSKPGR